MKLFQIFLALIVFFVSCFIGFSIARQKPIWGDEMTTERSATELPSYWDIIAGHTPTEGNKAIIHLCFQKWIDHIFSYQLPDNINMGWSGLYTDKRAQVICRIGSILWMSLSITLIFYYFIRTTGLWAGGIALLITLSTFMVWGYWAEDRVYPFWFLLTSVQSLCILWSSQHSPKRSDVLGCLMVTNFLLAVTSSIGIVQIIVISIWMFFAGYRKITDYILTSIIPCILCFYYLTQSQHLPCVFFSSAWKIIPANIPVERIALVFGAGLYLMRQSLKARDYKSDMKYLLYFALLFAAGSAFLLVLRIKAIGLVPSTGIAGVGVIGYTVEARQFIYLASVGIITSTFVLVRLIQVNSSKRIRVALVLLLLVMTVPRIWKYTHFSFASGKPEYLGLVSKAG